MRSNTSAEYPTRSILLTATTTCRMPSSDAMKLCRRVCAARRAGVDQDDGDVARRRAGRHVARVLLVPGRVGDDELAPRRREVAVGDVDRDALLALGLEAVGQQREVDLARRWCPFRSLSRFTAASWSS
jgi:hypothetical protein